MIIDPRALESVGMVGRAVHTRKGSSAVFEPARLAGFGHQPESIPSRGVHLDAAAG